MYIKMMIHFMNNYSEDYILLLVVCFVDFDNVLYLHFTSLNRNLSLNVIILLL